MEYSRHSSLGVVASYIPVCLFCDSYIIDDKSILTDVFFSILFSVEVNQKV